MIGFGGEISSSIYRVWLTQDEVGNVQLSFDQNKRDARLCSITKTKKVQNWLTHVVVFITILQMKLQAELCWYNVWEFPKQVTVSKVLQIRVDILNPW
jgi:hypothetical protein